MKKLILLSLFILALNNVMQGQQNTFSKVYYDSLRQGISVSGMTKTTENGCMLVGSVSNNLGGYILKTDSAGNMLWSKSFISVTNGYPPLELKSIVTTSDSCYLTVGNIYDVITQHHSALCIKLKSNGDTLWSKAIKNSNYDINVNAVQQTNDSGFVLVGSAKLISNSTYQIFAAKVDVMGNLLWIRFLSLSANNFGYSIKQTPDSGYVIIGTNQNSSNPTDVLLIKLTINGNFSWTKKYNLNPVTTCSGNDLVVTSTGFCLYFNSVNNSNHGLIKTDFLGNVLWSKSYLNYANYGYVNPKLIKTSKNEYVIISGSCGGSIMLKADTSGNILWSNQINFASVGVTEMKDKGYLIAGEGPICGAKSAGTTSPQIGLIKTDSLGAQQMCIYSTYLNLATNTVTNNTLTGTLISIGTESSPNITLSRVAVITDSGCVSFTGGIGKLDNTNKPIIYPNPANTILNIDFRTMDEKVELTIVDILGRRFINQTNSTNLSSINIANLPNGIYFVNVKGESNNNTQKILVQH